MTISVLDYFETRKADRKKEPRFLAVINKDSCTSCNSCATQCPVDCIYEVVSNVPSQSYHQIDTSRCIACQLCYRIPTESTDHYTLEVCPWNAIDMVHNPNVKPDPESILEPYYRGKAEDVPFPKIEEYGYQLFLDGEVFLPAGVPAAEEAFSFLTAEDWYYDDDVNVAIVSEVARDEKYVRYVATEEGRAVMDCVFEDYGRMFLD